MLLQANQKLGPYILIRQIGQGAFSVVWLAERRGALATTEVALKLIPITEQFDLKDIEVEAKIWVQAGKHPNVLSLIEADIYDNQIVIVSEYAPDGSLHQWLDKNRERQLQPIINMVCGILSGLVHLHSKKIIHRDLKPANILLHGETPRLADFGIARLIKPTNQTNSVAGTPIYMAPEAFEGKFMPQTDIWSVGVIFYQLLTNTFPFPNNDTPMLLKAIFYQPPNSLPQFIPSIIQEIVFRALEKDLTKRYQTANEMLLDLQKASQILQQTISPSTVAKNRISYSAEISRSNPSCFIFLVDRSSSMADSITGQGAKRKADAVADCLNRLLQNLVIKCSKSEGIRDYYYVGVIGYGSNIGLALGGALATKNLVPISEIAFSPVRIEDRIKKVDDGMGGIIEQKVKFPVWIEPFADGGTPMAEVFRATYNILVDWIAHHPNSFPPVVINITDGDSNSDPTNEAKAIMNLATSDGNVLLFNCHISDKQVAPILFPESEANLADPLAKKLFWLSSPLPAKIRENAYMEGYPVTEKSRGFAFNADMVELIRFLDIGTRPGNLR